VKKLKKFKIRASSASKISGGTIGLTNSEQKELDTLNDRKKDFHQNVPNIKPLTDTMEKRLQYLWHKRTNPELPQTAKSYCDAWIKEQIYNRRKEFTSKYTDKGLITEDNSLDFLAEQLDLGFVFKNEAYYEDDFCSGTPDTLLEDLVIDVKNPWDCFTFPLMDDKPTIDYEPQLQVYMSLTGRKKASLVYVLSDTPFHLIQKEAYYYANDNGLELDDVIEEFTAKMTYPDVDDKYKIKVYDFEYNEDFIKDLHMRVKLCREYIAGQLKKLGL